MTRLMARLAPALLLTLAAAAGAEQYSAITVPCNDVTIRFLRPGRVVEIPQVENSPVKKGQMLAHLDDSEESKAYTQDKARADDNTKTEAQRTIRAHEDAKLAKIKYGAERGAASSFELEEMKLSVLVEEAKVKLTDFEHAMEKLKADQSKVVLEKMVINSPIDGKIEKQFVKVGESVEPSTPVVRVVDLSKLHAESPVPFDKAVKLKIGDPGTIIFSDKTVSKGTVVFIAGVADAASQTLLVRVEVPNPQTAPKERPAGERVKVEFPGLENVANK